ncbi:MAG: hypothetical protein BWY42_01680 [Candidatus Omnitrophica bacterium ADurb.Bin277]|nr:MAG: hypothetical protein BWY42_01680 [Candidatus Omnitrophica bacterium ADurb.Bin277]
MKNPKNLNGAGFDPISHNIRRDHKFTSFRDSAGATRCGMRLEAGNFPDNPIHFLFRDCQAIPGNEREQIIKVFFGQIEPANDHRCFSLPAALIFFFTLATTSEWL